MPFLLKEHLSYSQLATFALASYPYSLKLLWSPIVDSVYWPPLGRRKSWIIPMQTITGSLMLYISLNSQRLLTDASMVSLAATCCSHFSHFSQVITSLNYQSRSPRSFSSLLRKVGHYFDAFAIPVLNWTHNNRYCCRRYDRNAFIGLFLFTA